MDPASPGKDSRPETTKRPPTDQNNDTFHSSKKRKRKRKISSFSSMSFSSSPLSSFLGIKVATPGTEQHAKPDPKIKSRCKSQSEPSSLAKLRPKSKAKKKRKFVGCSAFSLTKKDRHALPIESLEQILIESQNLNFARASPHLGFLLSSKVTLLNIITAAFAPSWETWRMFCTDLDSKHQYPDLTDEEKEEALGDPTFQAAVLSAPWAKLPILLEAFHKYCNQDKHSNIFSHTFLWRSIDYLDAPLDSPIRRHFPPSPEPHLHFSYAPNCPISNTRSCFLVDFAILRSFQQPNTPDAFLWTSLEPLPGFVGSTPEPLSAIPIKMRIPDTLLSGPWHSWEEIARLFFLARLGARPQEDQLWEVVLAGYHRILLLRDRRVAGVMLQILDTYEAWKHWPNNRQRNLPNGTPGEKIDGIWVRSYPPLPGNGMRELELEEWGKDGGKQPEWEDDEGRSELAGGDLLIEWSEKSVMPY